MKTLILPLVLCLAVAPAIAGKCTANDRWLGPDKSKHLFAGAGLGATVTLLTKEPDYGFWTGAAIGLGKELRDMRKGQCTFQDFAVTSAGAAAGAYGTAWLILPMRDERGGSGVQVFFSKRL